MLTLLGRQLCKNSQFHRKHLAAMCNIYIDWFVRYVHLISQQISNNLPPKHIHFISSFPNTAIWILFHWYRKKKSLLGRWS